MKPAWGLITLPAMRFKGTESYLTSESLRSAVDCAVALQRPLLVKGEPGTGKTLLAEAIAAAMGLKLLTWNVKSTTKAQDGLYVYDMTMRSKGKGRYRRRGIDWPVVKCALRQQRVAGYRFRKDLEKKLPEAEIWFASPPGAPFAVLTRFSSRLPLGVATISLTSYTAR
jgi:MoxR-like ATPase